MVVYGPIYQIWVLEISYVHKNNYLLHSVDPQFSVKLDVPLQNSPSFSGAGLSQVLLYLLIPPVHSLLQGDILHEDHPPCTGTTQRARYVVL